jgi:phage shock protein A
MMKTGGESSFPRDALEQALIVIKGWQELKDQLQVPNMSLKDFEKNIEETRRKIEEAEEKRRQRIKAIQNRNASIEKVWDLTKRVRNSAKATFGDDSPEIVKFGGKSAQMRKAYLKRARLEKDQDED